MSLRALLPAPRWADVPVLGLLVLMAVIGGLTVGRPPLGDPGHGLIVTVVTVAQSLLVLWRRDRPVAALLVLCATVPFALASVGAAPEWAWAVLVFAVVRRSSPRRAATVVVVSTVLALVLGAVLHSPTEPLDALAIASGIGVLIVPILAVAAGLAVAARMAARRADAERRAAQRARLTEALAAQRDRIGDELRTLVATRVERLVARIRALPSAAEPGDLDAPLAAAADEARAALAGMRSALRTLRDPDDGHAALLGPTTPRASGARAWLPSTSGWVLAVTVAALVLVTAWGSATARPHVPVGPLTVLLDAVDLDPARPWGLVTIAIQVLTVAWWRTAPLTALVVATAGSVCSVLLGSTHIVAEASWGLLVYGAGLGAGVVVSGVVVALFTTVILLVSWLERPPLLAGVSAWSLVVSFALVPVVWGIGVAQRRAARTRAEREAARATAVADRAVRAQRLGLARELHDVLAHELSALVVTLNAARVAPSAEALATVAETGERIAAALPGLLEGGAAPAGGLDEPAVQALVAPARDAGLPVEVEVSGAAGGDRPEADLFAARIVTEALTNALRHAGPSPTRVTVVHQPDEITVEVVDHGVRDGHDPASEGSGLGLVGMRERAALVGGELEAGRAGAGWRVAARLPRRAAGLLLEEETRSAGSSSGRTPAVPAPS